MGKGKQRVRAIFLLRRKLVVLLCVGPVLKNHPCRKQENELVKVKDVPQYNNVFPPIRLFAAYTHVSSAVKKMSERSFQGELKVRSNRKSQ